MLRQLTPPARTREFPYTLDLYHNTLINIRRLWRPLLVALYALVLLLVAADRLYPRLRPLWRRASAWAERRRPVWAGALILALGGYALYHYAVGFRVMHGFSGATTIHDVAEDDDGRELIVLYVGDFDPSCPRRTYPADCRNMTATMSRSSGSR